MLKVLVRGALLAAVGTLLWQNLPDIKRYLRILRM
ncbi:DUF6893 family small protein [Kitasatospora kifunensis]|uniref:Uncharacterized protein n=1 Tax=Kitasatospora kifunensis TaxID=58351 RepID=A0A7W7QZ48_KITKI|nr:hypothetical protein [Kitasatospora kifunensis]